MNEHEQKCFDTLYQRHVRALKLHGYAASTIDVYSRAVRRLATYYDCVPDQLSIEQLEIYFAELIESHSWATCCLDSGTGQTRYRTLKGEDFLWLVLQHVLPQVPITDAHPGLYPAGLAIRVEQVKLQTHHSPNTGDRRHFMTKTSMFC